MNALKVFMGCMYPGSIRTESIESMDHDHPGYQFEVTNIDERGNEVSNGQLQLTDTDLIYFRPSKFPIRWSIGCIRRYGCTDRGEIFTFETGRKSPTGEAIYAFRLSNGIFLVNQLKERIENSTYTDIPTTDVGQVNRRPRQIDDDLKPLPYSVIDLIGTELLNELAQAHVASRGR